MNNSKNMISNRVSNKTQSTPETISFDDQLDINDYITGGREGILSFIVTGGSEVDDISCGCIAFVDVFQEPKNGDRILWKYRGKNYIRRFNSYQKGLYLVGNRKPKKDSRIKGVVKAYLTVYENLML